MKDKRKKAAKDTHSMLSRKRLLLISLLLLVVAFIAFWQVMQCDFTDYDDTLYVTENRYIQDGITAEGILWAFTTGHAANWHPLTWISHMLDVQLFGLQPGWHHLTNLLFHLANTLLLFLSLHRMTKALWQSAFVAALFALHPLHVESVAWVAERKDVLSTFFWMLTLCAYSYYVERQSLRRYLALLMSLAVGLLAKPMLVTLPFVLLLLDYWPLGRFGQGRSAKGIERRTVIVALLREKIPLFALALLSCVVTYLVQQKGGAVGSTENFPLGLRTENAFVSYILYIGKTIWPTNLAVFYPYPGSWPLWQVWGAVLLLVAVTIVLIRGGKRFPYVPVGWLWYVGTLVPVIGLVQVGSQAMADRYTYIPLIGLFIMVAWAVPELLKKWPYRNEALIASSAVCLLCLFIVTWRQVGYWRNSFALYDHALEVAPPSSLMHYNRGNIHMNLGNYTQAIADLSRAIELNPRYGEAYYNRGVAYINLSNYTHAIEDFSRAIELNPKYGKAYNNRGVVYNSLGNYTEAIADFNKAVELTPKYGEAYNNRGVAYNRLGDYRQAIADFNKAIEVNPKYGKAYYNRGLAYGSLGDREHAIDDLRTAARLGNEGATNFLRSRGIGW